MMEAEFKKLTAFILISYLILMKSLIGCLRWEESGILDLE